MSYFSIILFFHILSAIAAVGTNITYRLLLSRARRQPDQLLFTLQAIRMLDRCLANPAYTLVLLTGLVMVLRLSLPLTTPWLLSAIVLYVLIAVLGITVVAPVFRRQIQLATNQELAGKEYQSTAQMSNILGIVATALAVLIVFLMVTKPALWGG
jgi:uncharacterized membrane protein